MEANYNNQFIRILLIIFSFSLLCTLARAQEEYSIRGTIRNESGEALAYANVAIRAAKDSALIGGTITDEEGDFNFKIANPGSYFLTASFIGFKSVDKTILPGANGVSDAGKIILRKEESLFDEVLIKQHRKKAKQQLGLTSFYVNSHMKSVSETGIQLISQVPGISVDLMNTVSLNGSKQIKILVNGVERDADYLGQIDANRIDRIDIQENGGLQYDASVSGIINVILKKEKHNGISGHVYANLPTKSDEVFSFPSASLNFSRNNTSWYTSYNGAFSNFRIEGKNQKTFFPNSDFKEITRKDELRQNNWSHKLHFGMDRLGSEKSQISLYGFVSGFSNEQDGQFAIEESSRKPETKSYTVVKDDEDKNRSGYASMYLKHRFSSSEILSLEGSTYLLRSKTGLILYGPEYEDNQVSQSQVNANKTNLRARFTSRINENLSIDAGIEEQLNFMQDKQIPSFNYSERIFSGYFQGQLNSQFLNVEGGIRTEHARTIYKDVLDQRRLFLLPQLKLKYDINSKSSLQFNYGKQIRRPQLHQLNPRQFALDRFSIQKGNPKLTSEMIQNLSATYSISFRENFFSASIFYRKRSNVIEDITRLTAAGALEMEKQNLGDLNYAGVKLLSSMNLHDNFSINSNVAFSYVQSRGNKLALDHGIKNQRGQEFRGEMSAIWSLEKDFSLSASMQFQNTVTGIQRNYREGTLYFVSLQKLFFKRLKVDITSAIPFKRSFVYQGYDIAADDFTVASEDKINMSMIPIWFKLNYSFSSGNKVRHLKRDKVFEEKREQKGF